MKKIVSNAAIFIMAVLGIVSCENELTPLGGNLLGANPEGIIKETEFEVKTYSVPVNPVQTSNFNSFPFGIYKDPIFGTSIYDLVTQVSLQFANPRFGNNIELEDVVLEIPYFSTPIAVDGEETTYRLDSLYGNDPVKFEIYRSNYFLSSIDPDQLTERAVYYSNFESTIQSNQGELIYNNDSFYPDAAEIDITETEEVDGAQVTTTVRRLSPRIIERLDINRWKELLFNIDASGNIISPRSELVTNNLFQDYFRGLYFKVTPLSGDGHMIHLNLNEAKITLKVSADTDQIDVNDTDGDGLTDDFVRLTSDVVINLNGNRAGFIENDFNPSIVTAISSSNDPINGAESLYLKGGPGAIAIVELFGQATNEVDGEATELTDVIANNWLINDAYIEFYVNQEIVGPDDPKKEPERILIYDYDTKRLLSDYVLPSSTAGAINSNLTHLGRLQRLIPNNSNTIGVKYKIRLTQHLSNIVAGNSENTRLAIVVSQNVNLVTNSNVLNDTDMKSIPISAAISHEGTVLHGNQSTNTDKRPKLKVFYSETMN